MAFFKRGSVPLTQQRPDYVMTVAKLRYVIGEDGKGCWIQPTLKPMDNNYDEELPF